MPLKKLIDFLDDHKIKYVSIKHSQAYTAQELAASVHLPGKEMAKTVMIKVNGKIAMAVLPATEHVDIELLKALTSSENVELAHEQEFMDLFPECETGAMPPFGNLYDMDVYVEKDLAQDKLICFNAGTHTEMVRMSYKDYERLVNPAEGHIFRRSLQDLKQHETGRLGMHASGPSRRTIKRRPSMPIYMLFGKYSQESLKGASAERTKKAQKIIEKNGGKIISMYAVMGEHDVVFTLDFPDADKALSASVALNVLTGISFNTSPVVDVEQFDRLLSEVKNI